ncbi:unnamed protein product [Penicillium nalgiovense]|nr:unnamed protein product [Penicillium nalgiovense]
MADRQRGRYSNGSGKTYRRSSQYLHLAISIITDLQLDRPPEYRFWRTRVNFDTEPDRKSVSWGREERRAVLGYFYLSSSQVSPMLLPILAIFRVHLQVIGHGCGVSIRQISPLYQILFVQFYAVEMYLCQITLFDYKPGAQALRHESSFQIELLRTGLTAARTLLHFLHVSSFRQRC